MSAREQASREPVINMSAREQAVERASNMSARDRLSREPVICHLANRLSSEPVMRKNPLTNCPISQ